MGYRHPILEPGADARRDLLAAPVVLGAHLDTPESEVDDETLVGALSAFMDAHECYLASLGARHGIMLDSGCCPRTRATACASSCAASADGPTPPGERRPNARRLVSSRSYGHSIAGKRGASRQYPMSTRSRAALGRRPRRPCLASRRHEPPSDFGRRSPGPVSGRQPKRRTSSSTLWRECVDGGPVSSVMP